MVVGVGVLLIVLGVWNAIDGLTALLAGGFVLAEAERVVALEVAGWGWVLLALGVVEAIAGIALFIGADLRDRGCWSPASTGSSNWRFLPPIRSAPF
jgi:predicted phage tail protein